MNGALANKSMNPDETSELIPPNLALILHQTVSKTVRDREKTLLQGNIVCILVGRVPPEVRDGLAQLALPLRASASVEGSQ
jgi:hypothetical protein